MTFNNMIFSNSKTMLIEGRRGLFLHAEEILSNADYFTDEYLINILDEINILYRTLVAILYNFVPASGHPGGSISSGRIVESLIFRTMLYDFRNPDREDSDIISYAAGHKALGLYAMWALRDELVSAGDESLVPDEKARLRLEDLLGFRRNPNTETPLFLKFRAKSLDGHPTPATPFIKIATGASGVGVPASFGLALGAIDTFGRNAPKVHIIEGEGGLTAGRAQEALCGAASAQLKNIILHIDWNQASIDSNRVCRDEAGPGDYVQWQPHELLFLDDWNVIFVTKGMDFKSITAAQDLALNLNSDQPTAVVYRTVKGHKYGIEGRLSHGAGHKYCSEGYFSALKEAEDHFSVQFPRNSSGTQSQEANEKMFYDTLLTIRSVIEKRKDLSKFACTRIIEAEEKLSKSGRKPREKAPDLSKIYPGENISPYSRPSEACFSAGQKITLREALGLSINCLNKITGGAFFGTTADLLDSTSLSKMNLGFPAGLYSSEKNPFSRLIAMGGICEDAMGAFMAGLSSFGRHIGVSASYGAFIASLEHIAARLHGIAQQAKHSDGYRTWIMVNAHTGLKTGEDGPTHACPQSLQLLQENFPKGVLITLTPWEPNEVWPLLIAGLTAKPAVLAPFTTRPPETVPDRQKLKLPPVHAVIKGIYAMRKADPSSKQQNGTIVLQGSGVTYNFVFDVLPKLDEMGLNINVYYVTSAELFESLPLEEQEELFSEETCRTAMGITDFTLPTMYKWIGSREGLKRTLHPFRNGHYPGSGQGDRVLAEAGLDAKSQLEHILEYVRDFEKRCQVSGVRCQE